MRWLVEVSAIGKSDPQSFCVEGDSWQRALQIVRSHRGEPGAMNGFSIELLEEGYRAVDPVARLRFVVKRAPEGTPLSPIEMTPAGSQPPNKNDSKAPGAVISPAPPAPTVSGAAPAAPPVAAAAAAAPAAPASGKVPPAAESKPKVGPPRPGASGAGTSGPFPTSTAKADSTPKADPPKAEGLPTDGAPTVEITKAPGTSNGTSVPPPKTNGPVTLEMSTHVPPQALPSQPHTEPSPTVVAPQPVGAPLPNLPPFTVLSKREEHPSPSAPLSYREYVFVVPPGTVEGTAVQILLGQLELVQGALGNEKPGKLVQLAAFDETYTGKPPRPPLATLVWKDWRGEPVVSFPRRASLAPPGSKPTPSSTVPSLKPASVPPKATLLEPKTTLDDTRALNQKPDVVFAPPDTEVTKTEVDLETAKTVETPVFQGPKGAPTMIGIPTQAFGSPSPASAAAAPAPVLASPSSQAGGSGPNTQASQPSPAPVQAAAAAAPLAVPAGPIAAAPVPASTAPAAAPAPAVVATAVISIPAAPVATAQSAPAAIPPAPQVGKSVPPPAAPAATAPAPAGIAPAPAAIAPAPAGIAPAPAAIAPVQQASKSVPPPAAPTALAPTDIAPAQQASKSVPPPAADPMAKTLPVGTQGPTDGRPSPAPAGVLGVEKAPDFTPPPGHASSMRLPVAKPGGRVSGDELIGALFEAMHDLHFLRDAIEGAEFCLQLANEAIPSRASFAHFYDMEKREYVLVRTSGRDTKALVGKRHLEGEPLLAAAVKARRAMVRSAEDAMSNRYTAVGGAKSLVVAPVFVAGRALAVLEIVNALDGAPFTQDEANAMNYIAEQFAEFLSSRGVVLDQARIQLAGG